MERARTTARRLAQDSLRRGDPTGWFDELYASAAGDPGAIQWADLAPNPHLMAWLGRDGKLGNRALVVGCGLGDDAEALAWARYTVTAFDISPTAVAWCRSRFPSSQVDYVVGNALAPAPEWLGAFDLVVEAYTLQVLPFDLRQRAVGEIARCVAPGGTLLAIARGRDADDDPGAMPWPLLRSELDAFQGHGLVEVTFEDFLDAEEPPVRRFRAEYRRPRDADAGDDGGTS